MEGYAFTSEMKNLLRNTKELNKDNYECYLQHVKYLETIAPSSKKTDIDNIRKILEKKEPAKWFLKSYFQLLIGILNSSFTFAYKNYIVFE